MENIPNYAFFFGLRGFTCFNFLANLRFMLAQKYQVYVITQALVVFAFQYKNTENNAFEDDVCDNQ